MDSFIWKKMRPEQLQPVGVALCNCMQDNSSRYLCEGEKENLEYWILYRNEMEVVIVGTHRPTKTIFGIKGKHSQVPFKYKEYILEFLNEMKEEYRCSEIHGFMHYLRIAQVNGVWVDVEEIPDNTTVHHTLNLNNYHVRRLPNGLTVEGSLLLCNSKVQFLPTDLCVTEYIDVRLTEITIPDQNNKVLNTSKQIREYHNGPFRKEGYSRSDK